MRKHRNVEDHLTPWQPEDGEYIHLAALLQSLPGFRWDLYLLGITAGNRGVHRTQPLLGRTRRGIAVVLLSSLSKWLTHYNPDAPAVVEAMLGDLRVAERVYLRKLNDIRAEVRAKSGEALGRKSQPKVVAKVSKPIKIEDKSVFGVWG